MDNNDRAHFMAGSLASIIILGLAFWQPRLLVIGVVLWLVVSLLANTIDGRRKKVTKKS